MKDGSKLPLAVVISLLSLIVSTTVLVFGNNIFDRLTGPKIIMNSTDVILDYPDDINKVLCEYRNKNKIPFIPDSYTEIIIQNTGILASKNATIQVKSGDHIFELSSYSTESITEEKRIDDSTYNIQMQRLSKNAYIKIEIWAKSSNQPMSVIYADDYNSRQLIEGDSYKESSLIIKILMFIILLISIVFLTKFACTRIMKYAEEKRLQQDCDLFIKISNLLEAKEDEKLEQEEKDLNECQDFKYDDEETKEKLKRLIKKVKEE